MDFLSDYLGGGERLQGRAGRSHDPGFGSPALVYSQAMASTPMVRPAAQAASQVRCTARPPARASRGEGGEGLRPDRDPSFVQDDPTPQMDTIAAEAYFRAEAARLAAMEHGEGAEGAEGNEARPGGWREWERHPLCYSRRPPDPTLRCVSCRPLGG